MKRIVSFIVIFSLLLSVFTACSNSNPDSQTDELNQTIEELSKTNEELTKENDDLKKSYEELFKTNEGLNKASDSINELTDVRIIYLPPMTVAAYKATGNDCEGKALGVIDNFAEEYELFKIKLDVRQFGFDCSDGQTAVGETSRAYEAWISIPDDMEVPEPLIKRKFEGGLYAVQVMRTWDDWRLLGEWVNASDKYDNAWGEARWTPDETGAGQGFEEQLNYWGHFNNGDFNGDDMQLDLLFPIKEKK